MLCAAVSLPGAETPSGDALRVRFWRTDTEISGAVRDESDAGRLRDALARARPGCHIWDDLTLDPAAPRLPSATVLSGLVQELVLSTRDGCLTLSSAEGLKVSGLTDSLVTHAAFEMRLLEVAREVNAPGAANEIKIVSSEELARPGPERPIRGLNPKPLVHKPVVLADAPYGPPTPPLRAKPLAPVIEIAVAESPDDTPMPLASPAPDPDPAPLPPEPVAKPEPAVALATATAAPTTFELPPPPWAPPVDPVAFGANSFLVGIDQLKTVEKAARRIAALPPKSGKVILRGYPDSPGHHPYNDWLSRTRAREVKRALTDLGIAEDALEIAIFPAGDKADRAESQRRVEILLPGRG
ncbi:MAG: OmpA family protein [Akkermansiaceae bacterium]|nr:OmpA family protein [Akkermansiaceae bacterium]